MNMTKKKLLLFIFFFWGGEWVHVAPKNNLILLTKGAVEGPMG